MSERKEEEKYIVLASKGFVHYDSVIIGDNAKERAIEIAKFYFKVYDNPKVFKIEEEIDWKEQEKIEEDKRIKVVFDLRDLGNILIFLDIRNIDYDIYAAPGKKKGVVSGICLYKEEDFLSLENAFKNFYPFCFNFKKVNEWPY